MARLSSTIDRVADEGPESGPRKVDEMAPMPAALPDFQPGDPGEASPVETELAELRRELLELRRLEAERRARHEALLTAATSLRSARDEGEAVARTLAVLRSLSELGLAAVGLPEGGQGSASRVRGFLAHPGGDRRPLEGRAELLDLLRLSPERRRLAGSHVMQGFRASVQGEDDEASPGDRALLAAVFDGAPTGVVPLWAEDEAAGFLLIKAREGKELDEAVLGAPELVAGHLAAALDGIRRHSIERRRSRWARKVSRLGRLLLNVRTPELVLERATAALRAEWPDAAVDAVLLSPRPEARPLARSALARPQLLVEPPGEASASLGRIGAQVRIPIRTPAGLRALLVASAPQGPGFDAFDREGLESFAKVVAGALSNAELFHSEARGLRSLGLVARIGRLAGASLEARDLLEPVLAELTAHGSFETVAVARLDRVRGKLVRKAQASRAGLRFEEGFAAPLDEGFLSRVARSGEARIADERIVPGSDRWRHASTRSEIGVPLRVLDRVIGVLDIQSRRPEAFDQEDLVVAEAVADHLARALHNARLHQAVKTANREIRAGERRKTAFLATVAHDLRTPLTSIRSSAEVMLMYEGAPAAERREFLEGIRDESARLGRLVDDFLAHARIEGGDLEFEVVEFRLDDLLRHFTRLFEGPAARRGLRLECRIDDGLPAVLGDPERVSQVVANLLSNATKYTPDDGRVLVTACPMPAESGQVLGKVLVGVADTGTGIQESDREKIFQRFVRIDGDPRAPRGAGLGLPIARSLVEHQGGRLWCDGRRGGGAVFHFSLPAFLD